MCTRPQAGDWKFLLLFAGEAALACAGLAYFVGWRQRVRFSDEELEHMLRKVSLLQRARAPAWL